ncbi:uncharacterized protein LOC113217090 [Frankliniella occidentalis]|uniref:Uncharacterized protein LOC113217090 n=1 Tax=Frankliniella occidentalis TaxID=133901 RepID=A0A9C6WZY1_FRAOC|nr:uncharacterized protein LOC113217090 [Frankliniella occidentalis]
MRKRQFTEARTLAREVHEYRGLLDAARSGDKQLLRNTLRRDRPTQIAFGGQSFERALDHLEQSTFTLQKEMDHLRCLKKQRARQLLSLETEAMNLQREWQARARQPLREVNEQVLTSQITNCVVKQNAAASVNHTYHNILAILRKDKVYFDAVLGALHADQVTQCRCVVRATQLGQAAAEDVARLREEAKAEEADLKLSMQERASAVKSLRAVVDHNKRVARSHVHAESSTDLRLVPTREDDGSAALLKELDQMEGIMQGLQATTLVASHLEVLPRFEEQRRQRQRLTRQVERRQLARDEVLARRNHATLILHDLKHNMNEAEEDCTEIKTDYFIRTA